MYVGVFTIGSGSAGAFVLVLLATLIGFNYGANLALFPSFTKDLWGIKHFGVNYGIVFTAWGVGGFVMSRASQTLMARTNTFTAAFVAAGALLMVGTVLTFLIKDHGEEERKEIARRLNDEPERGERKAILGEV